MRDPKQDPDLKPTEKWDPDDEKIIPDPKHWEGGGILQQYTYNHDKKYEYDENVGANKSRQ
jgi:hypothetical protein